MPETSLKNGGPDPSARTQQAHGLSASALRLAQVGEWQAALNHARLAVDGAPQQDWAWQTLAEVARAAGAAREAAQAWRGWLRFHPEDAAAWHRLGESLQVLMQHHDAAEAFRAALRLRPSFAGSQNNLGNSLRQLGALEQAVQAYRGALQKAPTLAAAHFNLAVTLRDLGDLHGAVASFEAAADCGNAARAQAEALATRQMMCDWRGRDQAIHSLVKATERALATGQAPPVEPFTTLAWPVGAELQLAVARRTSEALQTRVGPAPLHRIERHGPVERLRIAYLSSDIYEHATAQLIAGMFRCHEHDRFEVFLYSHGPDDGSAVRRRIVDDCEHFVDLQGHTAARIAERIAADGIHVLIDLKGHTRRNALEALAWRPAPVQATYLGFPGSTGASFIDYVITDAVVTPPALENDLCEAVVRLPHSYQINDDGQHMDERTPARAELGLPEQGVVFCCFNNNYKIEPVMFACWMRILAQVPGSVLWLLRGHGEAEARLRREAALRGIEPARLVFAERVPKPAHLARHRCADLFLDTLFYNAHTTASDALWTGLPVLTCMGQTFAARVAASLLHAAGLPELVTESLAEYEQQAVSWAVDPGRLKRLKEKLRGGRGQVPLFDTAATVRALEAAYQGMWQRFRDDAGVSSFDVSSDSKMDGVARTPRQAMHDVDPLAVTISAHTTASSDALAEGAAALEAGDLQIAMERYLTALEQRSDEPTALAGLARVLRLGGALDQAQKVLAPARERHPGSVELALEQAHMARARNEGAKAIADYRFVLQSRPQCFEALAGKATVEHLSGDLDAALETYRHALEADADALELRFNFASALQSAGEWSEARTHYQICVEHQPDYRDAWLNLAKLLRDSGDYDAAFSAYERVHGLCPEADSAFRLGVVRHLQERYAEALPWYEEAIKRAPDRAHYWNTRGNACKALGRVDEAERAYKQALHLDPRYAEAHNHLGLLYRENGRLGTAIQCFQRAAALKPDSVPVQFNQLLAAQEACDWEAVATSLDVLIPRTRQCLAQNELTPIAPFMSLSLPLDAELQRDIARNYTRCKVQTHLPATGPLHRNPGVTDGRLRIGYVSPNFRNHPTSHLMVQLFECHNHERFEIFVYSSGADDGSEYRQRIRRAADHFIDISTLTPMQAAERIAADGIHILVDRAGHTFNARTRIFALRPAPVQVNYIGFPGTMGANFMDYIITDHTVTPAQLVQTLDEQPVYMPHSYLVTDGRPYVATEAPGRAQCNLPEEAFVFCSFNNAFKIEPRVFGYWMEILRRVQGSVLWLLYSSPEARDHLRQAAVRKGVDAERLVFADRCSKPLHLARHAHADLFLDTLYYNAHTTAVDALYMGVPVLTLPGQTFPSRVCASLLHAAGLQEGIVDSGEAYVRSAVEWAGRPERLAAYRRAAANASSSPLFDTAGYARALENAFDDMWKKHLSGAPPAALEIRQ